MPNFYCRDRTRRQTPQGSLLWLARSGCCTESKQSLGTTKDQMRLSVRLFIEADAHKSCSMRLCLLIQRSSLRRTAVLIGHGSSLSKLRITLLSGPAGRRWLSLDCDAQGAVCKGTQSRLLDCFSRFPGSGRLSGSSVLTQPARESVRI